MQLSLLSVHDSQFGEQSSHKSVAEFAYEPDGHCPTQEPSWSRKNPVTQIYMQKGLQKETVFFFFNNHNGEKKGNMFTFET